ncbi:glycerate kinase family protein [Planococcus maritimus]|uniref:glycerate kinase family protein n=1 Tax=Planococcus maritimus TaxID=192421 RepID=UPI000794E598|nr:glycerate kinase [Planococcus maritimus]KYG60064.1 glycerate kinase [Planococcus maritimus]OED33750.1 glycerate kinase [Planococcus maritimus]
MKVLIAMDSFKGSLSSKQGSEAIAAGIKEVYPSADTKMLPLADGGEGTVEALVEATKGTLFTVPVIGPLQEKIEATYGVLGDHRTVVIEVAAACGLPLIREEQRNPLIATTFGVGELINDAIERGYRDFIIGLGGSATNDGGVGMLQALGFQFQDRHGKEIELGGQSLKDIRRIDAENVSPALSEAQFNVACDVTNPLYGETGAAYIFGPQKGATPEMVEELDQGLRNFARIASEDLGKDIQNPPGAGAAGGLGAAFIGFLQGELKSGIELILESVKMEEQIKGVDIVVTGEGKLDGQTSMGKTASGVAQLAKKMGVPAIALAGSITEEAADLNEIGITSYFSILTKPMTLNEAIDPDTARQNLQVTTAQLFRLIKAFKQ